MFNLIILEYLRIHLCDQLSIYVYGFRPRIPSSWSLFINVTRSAKGFRASAFRIQKRTSGALMRARAAYIFRFIRIFIHYFLRSNLARNCAAHHRLSSATCIAGDEFSVRLSLKCARLGHRVRIVAFGNGSSRRRHARSKAEPSDLNYIVSLL